MWTDIRYAIIYRSKNSENLQEGNDAGNYI